MRQTWVKRRGGDRTMPHNTPSRCITVVVCLFLLLTGASALALGAETRFTQADLVALLARDPRTGRPVDSVADLLPLLPADLRANFTFVYRSRSPFADSITPGHPRVILFSDDGTSLLTFTGEPEKAGGDILETAWFDGAAARFTFAAYPLPAALRRGQTLPGAAADCGGCHGADPRPIYDSYPLWPGFYGSVLDTFPHDALGATELERYLGFLAGSGRSGVYAGLRYRQGSRTTPFLDPHAFKDDKVELDAATFPFLPNARLGMALTELNRQRIFRKLAAGPGFPAREKRILALLLDCRGADRPSAQALRLIGAALERENANRLTRLGDAAKGSHPTLHDMQELSFVRELAEIDEAAALAGVDRSDWSMALETGSLAFFDGILSGIYRGRSYYVKEDLIFEILQDLARSEPAFRPYFAYDSVFASQGYTFGRRIAIGPALASCPLLVAPRPHPGPALPAP